MGRFRSGGRYLGVFIGYHAERAYGFIHCEGLEEDVYFHRSQLPREAQDVYRSSIAGKRVEFELLLTADGKPRAERLWPVDPIVERDGGRDWDRQKDRDRYAPSNGKGAGKKGDRPDRAERHERHGPPPPPLEPAAIEEMTRYLEERGGVMDYGKFSNSFPGVKKSQLEGHFVLVPESDAWGGRWQVTLPGVDPLTPEEREAREQAEAEQAGGSRPRKWRQDEAEAEAARMNEEEKQEEEDPQPPVLEPSAAVRLFGVVRDWDFREGSGYVVSEGADNALLLRADLPPEVHHWRGRFDGAEVSYELGVADDGRLQAVHVHLLLDPDGDGGFRVRGLGR